MTNLAELIEKKQAYVKQKAEEIVNGMVKRGVFTDTMSTHHSWDNELHSNMPEIAKELKKMGVSASSCVRWEVTDWVFKIDIT